MRKKLLHFTIVHSRTDTRIRVKQTASLATHSGQKVTLFVQDGQGAKNDDSGIGIVDTGPMLESRLFRMTLGSLRMLRAVRQERPKVAHFHDPELIPAGLALKLLGIKVIYDVHEDVPRQILAKFYLPLLLRKPVAWAMGAVEWIAGQCFDAIVPATPRIADRFPADKTVVVQNFPILEELVEPDPVPYKRRPFHFAYVGGITRARGALEMVEAAGRVHGENVKLCLAGAFSPKDLQAEAEDLPGWEKVDFHGWADRRQVANLLGSARAGLVVLHPTKRYPDAYPVKMFEYMAAGLPVIASDFPLWRQILHGAGCGLLVDPLDPDAIAGAMQWILENPEESEKMGKRGRQVVEEKYNWKQEAKKLISLYECLSEQKS